MLLALAHVTRFGFIEMIANLQCWIRVSRGCCGVAALFLTLVPTPALELLGIGRMIRNQSRLSLFPLLAIFCFLEASGFVILLTQTVASGFFPDTTTFVSESALILASFIYAEKATSNSDQHQILHVRAALLCLLCAVELLNVIQPGLPHQAESPMAYQLGSAIKAGKMTTCGIILSQILPSVLQGSKPLGEPALDLSLGRDLGSSSPSDMLGLQIELQREAKKLGGWWPVFKRFGIFLEYVLPIDHPLQMLRFVASFLLMLVHEITQMHQQFAFACLMDKATAGSSLEQPLKQVLVLWAVNITLPYLYGSLKTDVNMHRNKTFAWRVYSKIISMDPAFHSLTSPTDLTKAMDDSKPFMDLFDSVIFTYLIQLFGLAIAANNLISRHGLLLLVVMIYQATLASVINKYGVQKLSRAKLNARKAQLSQERFRQDSLRGWATLFNYNFVATEINRYQSIVESAIDQQRNMEKTRLSLSLCQNLVNFAGIAAGYSILFFQYGHGSATCADLIFFIPVWQKFWTQFSDLTRDIPDFVDALLDAAPLRRILERGSACAAAQATAETLACNSSSSSGDLRLINVSFAYPGMDKLVVDGLDLAIKPDTKVALIGPSGTGKTTLLKLFMRHLSPSSGVVLVDGQNIENIDKDSFHNFVGMVPQIPYMFNGTIIENIRVGKADATDEEVYEACRNAMIHDTIMARPDGYETQIGEQGGSLSGGEKQRIEFARLFLKRPKIVILDEPTANLDQETEQQVLRNLLDQFRDATIIMVTHHVQLAKHFNRVIFVGKGAKVENETQL